MEPAEIAAVWVNNISPSEIDRNAINVKVAPNVCGYALTDCSSEDLKPPR